MNHKNFEERGFTRTGRVDVDAAPAQRVLAGVVKDRRPWGLIRRFGKITAGLQAWQSILHKKQRPEKEGQTNSRSERRLAPKAMVHEEAVTASDNVDVSDVEFCDGGFGVRVTLRRGTRIPIITEVCGDSVEDFEEDVPNEVLVTCDAFTLLAPFEDFGAGVRAGVVGAWVAGAGVAATAATSQLTIESWPGPGQKVGEGDNPFDDSDKEVEKASEELTAYWMGHNKDNRICTWGTPPSLLP
ncbi:hypothetical protein C8J57DRAFT_1254634 [Mycena rebaudengoi]|nr:hypothetical protein C8J57DRAFT_1254634 [Mycena rebaudengoi]